MLASNNQINITGKSETMGIDKAANRKRSLKINSHGLYSNTIRRYL